MRRIGGRGESSANQITKKLRWGKPGRYPRNRSLPRYRSKGRATMPCSFVEWVEIATKGKVLEWIEDSFFLFHSLYMGPIYLR